MNSEQKKKDIPMRIETEMNKKGRRLKKPKNSHVEPPGGKLKPQEGLEGLGIEIQNKKIMCWGGETEYTEGVSIDKNRAFIFLQNKSVSNTIIFSSPKS